MLLPHKLKTIGWIILIPSLVLGIIMMFNEFSFDFLSKENGGMIPQNFTDELIGTFLICSLILVGFTKLKFEDEYTFRLRLESFQLTFYIYAVIMILAILTIYNDAFFDFMVLNLFAPLILFVLVFHVKILIFRNSGS